MKRMRTACWSGVALTAILTFEEITLSTSLLTCRESARACEVAAVSMISGTLPCSP